MKNQIELKIYVGTYAKYNNGSLFGEWLDVSDYSSADELIEAMKDLHSDEDDPEFMVQDYDYTLDIFSGMGECPDYEKIFEIKEMLESSYYESEIYVAYWAIIGGDFDAGTIRDAEDAYMGEFYSDEDFARNMAEETGSIDRNAKWPYNCIDWECAASYLMYDYFEYNGYYFRNL